MSLHTQNGNSDRENFGNLYNRYHQRLLNSMVGVVRDKEKAEDVTAMALNVAFQHRKTFRGESSFYTWLYTIALNQARSVLRERIGMSLDGFCEGVTHRTDTTERALERRENATRLNAALTTIPTIYRRVLMNHFIQMQSVKDIAARENIPVGTVLSRIFKGKQLLRNAWDDIG